MNFWEKFKKKPNKAPEKTALEIIAEIENLIEQTKTQINQQETWLSSVGHSLLPLVVAQKKSDIRELKNKLNFLEDKKRHEEEKAVSN